MPVEFSYLDYLNLSTDLLRISNWLRTDDDKLVDDFLRLVLKKFGKDEFEIGGKAVSLWLTKVARYHEDRLCSADDALKLSGLLNEEFVEIYLKNRFPEAN